MQIKNVNIVLYRFIEVFQKSVLFPSFRTIFVVAIFNEAFQWVLVTSDITPKLPFHFFSFLFSFLDR